MNNEAKLLMMVWWGIFWSPLSNISKNNIADMQCSVFSLIQSWWKGPVSGLCCDLKPSPILTRGKWWRWQTIPTKLFPWCSQRRGVNIMELWNKGICQNRQQNLNPLYLKNLQDQVTFISQFSQKWHEGKRLFSFDVQSPLQNRLRCWTGDRRKGTDLTLQVATRMVAETLANPCIPRSFTITVLRYSVA